MKIEVNLIELSKEIELLNGIKEDAVNTFSSIFKALSDSSFFWNDGNAVAFYGDIEKEKIKCDKEMLVVDDAISIYRYIYNGYSHLGKKIKCNTAAIDAIVAKIDNIISKINSIIASYKSLSTYFCPYERYYLNIELSKLKKDLSKIISIKAKIKDSYNKIIEIEKEVANKISKLDLVQITEFDLSKHTNK